MPSGTDRIPRTPTRTRRAMEGIGLTFVPYLGAVKDVDLGTFDLTTTGVITGEQITSTDDITMQGHLLTLGDVNVLADTVISFKGPTNQATITFDQSHNEFDFDDSNLTTTGVATITRVDIGTLQLNDNIISDSTGTISFDNENLDTAGNAMLFGSTGTAVDTVLTFRGANNTGTLTWDESSKEFDFNDANITTTGIVTVGTLSVTSLTLSGTLQAEQVTSTDDITMRGHLFTVGNVGQAVDTIFRFLGFNNSADFYFDESRNTFMLSDSANFETAGVGTFSRVDAGTLQLNDNIITDSTGTISFNDDHLTTTGNITASGSTVTAEQITSTHDITMQGWTLTLGTASANDITINFLGTANSGAIVFDVSHNEFDFGDSNLTTTGVATITRIDCGTLQLNDNIITDSTGTISFNDDHLTTTGNITAGASTFGDGGTTNYLGLGADGTLTLYGTAKVTNALWIGAEGVRAPPITKPATYVEHGIAGAWEFSDATDDTIIATMRIPNKMDRDVAPSLTLDWSSTTQGAFCEWQIEYLWRSANEDTTAAADDTLLSSTDADASTSSGTAEGLVLSTFPLVAPSETDACLHLRIKRRADLAADTINGDTVELMGICLSFTSNKLGA